MGFTIITAGYMVLCIDTKKSYTLVHDESLLEYPLLPFLTSCEVEERDLRKKEEKKGEPI